MKSYLSLIITVFCILLPFSLTYAVGSPTAYIQSLSPGNTVTPGNSVSFVIYASGFSSALSYSVSDSLSGSSVSSSNVNSSGVFSWIPTASDTGTHTITIVITDQSDGTATVSQQITVVNPTISIQSISPGTNVNVGQTIFFSTFVSGLSNPTYSLSDSLISSSITSSNINSAGNFSWTPKTQDVGSHTVTVSARDASNRVATVEQAFTISGAATATIQSLSPGNSVNSGQPVTFTIVPTGFTNPTYSFTDSFGTGNSGTINSSGVFSWTPKTMDTGSHILSIHVQDTNGNIADLSVTLQVEKAGLTIQSLSPGNTVTPGTPVSFTAQTSGFINPVYSVVDSFSGGTMNGQNINNSGVFSWTPKSQDLGTHSVTVYAIDGSGHNGIASIQITVSNTSTPSVQTTSVVNQTNTTGAKTKYTFTKPLTIGSKNADVTALQKILTEQGLFSGPVTGFFGPVTAGAVKKFQAKQGLPQVGNVGPATRAKLNSL